MVRFSCFRSFLSLLKAVSRSLLASAIAVGGTVIGAMHFVGNTALTLKIEALTRQIPKNLTYIAISFSLPVLVLLAAFYMLGTHNRGRTD